MAMRALRLKLKLHAKDQNDISSFLPRIFAWSGFAARYAYFLFTGVEK
ncbi:hypothetical protein [Glaciimonas sp. GG7]